MGISKTNNATSNRSLYNDDITDSIQIIYSEITMLGVVVNNPSKSYLMNSSVKLILENLQKLEKYARSQTQKDSITIVLENLNTLQEKVSAKLYDEALHFFSYEFCPSWHRLTQKIR
jgi:hypothetical protein